MKSEFFTVSLPLSREERAQHYIDRVERKRARDEARAVRRAQRIGDWIWNAAMVIWVAFVAFSVISWWWG